ncbi:CAP domain-containing protein [Candidatus Pacebacteria bacterium]|nr:CAP domain-containing protein [Candidatus Paceibacterota bacterium]
MHRTLFVTLVVLLVVGGFFEGSYQNVVAHESFLRASVAEASEHRYGSRYDGAAFTRSYEHQVRSVARRPEKDLASPTESSEPESAPIAVTAEPVKAPVLAPKPDPEVDTDDEVDKESVPISTLTYHSAEDVIAEPSEPFITAAAEEVSRGELYEAIHDLTNAAREQAGLTSLRHDRELAEIAEAHSKDMATRNFFSHTNPDNCGLKCRLDEGGYEVMAWGENIIYRTHTADWTTTELAEYFVESWLDSPGHRKNMLSGTYTHEGVGVYIDGHTVYVTVNFAVPK